MLLANQLVPHLFHMDISLIEKVFRTAAVYIGLLTIIRLVGKRDMAQLNSFDLVVLLLLSNVVQNAVIGPDNSLIGGLVGTAVLIGLNWAVVRLAFRHPRLNRLIQGTSSPLVSKGVVDERELASLGLTRNELEAALRRQGAGSIEEVEDATLAPEGTITLTLKPADQNATKGDIARVESLVTELMASLGGGGGAAPTSA